MVDHAGNTVEVPNHITRVVIDQIPILSTYMSYFGGEAPYIVGYCGSFKDTISKTVLKNIAPELMESADTVYAPVSYTHLGLFSFVPCPVGSWLRIGLFRQ